jgi:hypothetical protein
MSCCLVFCQLGCTDGTEEWIWGNQKLHVVRVPYLVSVLKYV